MPPTDPRIPKQTRRHAARGSRGAALALSIGTTVGLGGYLYGQSQQPATTATPISSSSSASSATTNEDTTTSGTTDTTATPSTAAPSTETPSVAAATTSGLADGTYVGEVDTNKWGPVQVQITVESGTISEITVLQYPDGDRKSVEINSWALPTLIEETLTAQSADVDSVSGATYTSDSYAVSLQSAIDQARAGATG